MYCCYAPRHKTIKSLLYFLHAAVASGYVAVLPRPRNSTCIPTFLECSYRLRVCCCFAPPQTQKPQTICILVCFGMHLFSQGLLLFCPQTPKPPIDSVCGAVLPQESKNTEFSLLSQGVWLCCPQTQNTHSFICIFACFAMLTVSVCFRLCTSSIYDYVHPCTSVCVCVRLRIWTKPNPVKESSGIPPAHPPYRGPKWVQAHKHTLPT